jgi:hypothetical protein
VTKETLEFRTYLDGALEDLAFVEALESTPLDGSK